MDTRFILSTILATLLFGISVGFFAGQGYEKRTGDPRVVTRTEHVPNHFRQLTPRFTVPDVRLVAPQLRKDEVRIDTIYVPVDMGEYRLISPRPISVNARQVTLDLYDPNLRVWTREVYNIPEPRFGFRTYTEASIDPWVLNPAVGIRAEFRYRRVYLFAGSEVRVFDGRVDFGVRVGIRYRIM
jgi:hypothetical protein